MGLGTCISGYAIAASNAAAHFLGIPRDLKAQTVFSVGFPKYKYKKTVDRRPPVAQYS
jgi:hypothetical protein